MDMYFLFRVRFTQNRLHTKLFLWWFENEDAPNINEYKLNDQFIFRVPCSDIADMYTTTDAYFNLLVLF